MKLLLDTNAYSFLFSQEKGIAQELQKADLVYMSVIVMGELLHGFYKGNQFSKNYQVLQRFLERNYVSILPVTEKTADHFGHIATELKRNGTPIPSNDIWIAAHTFEAEATLLSFDKHFHHIADLPLHTVT